MGRGAVGRLSMSRPRWLFRRAVQGVALIVAGIVAAMVGGWYLEHVDNPWVPSPRWLGWTLMTAVLAHLVFLDCRRIWHRPKVWFTLIGLFALHVAGYALMFKYVTRWRPVWFALLMLLECHIFLLVLYWVDHRVADDENEHRNAE
jgi:hypothetical protein